MPDTKDYYSEGVLAPQGKIDNVFVKNLFSIFTIFRVNFFIAGKIDGKKNKKNL